MIIYKDFIILGEYMKIYLNKKFNKFSKNDLIDNYLSIKLSLGHIPSITEFQLNSNISANLYINSFGSWYDFLDVMNDLTSQQKNYPTIVTSFLEFLEKTKMTKSYKMGLFLSVFDEDLKKETSLVKIINNFKNIYKELPFKSDFIGKKFKDLEEWKNHEYEILLLSFPIKYLTANKETKKFFQFINNNFILDENLYFYIKYNNTILEEVMDRINFRILYYFKN